MRNPLNRRLKREFKSDFGKYAVIFLFITLTIGFISGFLVADNSMTHAYEESFEKYNIEDGGFTLSNEADEKLIEDIEKEQEITIVKNYYIEFKILNDDTKLRVFADRESIDLVCVMQGSKPSGKNEIALDRLFAENNNLEIGDTIKMGSKDYEITGFVALSDYSAQFENNSDMMFDATNFGVAIVTTGQFDEFDTEKIIYHYSWENDDNTLTDKEKKDKSESIAKQLVSNMANVTDIVAEPDNQAIHFTGDDMGGDKSMMIVLLYVIMVILAFIFAITISNTIEKEASEIGTLRALGITRFELLKHYITLPVLVTIISCVIGNIMGYTFFKEVVVEMYYHSYSLPEYKTLWNAYAFVLTTVFPCIIMLFVNAGILWFKLKLSPLKLLRHDLSRHREKKAVKLPQISFISRFTIRILIQNKANYIIMFVGIVFAYVLIFFGLLMTPLLDHFADDVENGMISSHQYVLKAMAETKESSAEKYSVTTLNLDNDKCTIVEEITVYGIDEASAYVKLADLKDSTNEVYISNGIMEKYGYSDGDTISLKDKYSDKTYEYVIKGGYDYPAGFAVFMSSSQFCESFNKDEGYFNGYFSDVKLDDINEKLIATDITYSDMTKVVRQLKDSMGSMFPLIMVFAVFMAMLIFYLLSKIVIEKNAVPISMVRILGYNTYETAKLYIMSTSIAAIISIVLSLFIADYVLKWLYHFFMMDIAGWLTYYVAPVNYLKAFLMGIAAYFVAAALQYYKIMKIKLEEALKQVDI
jgi:putative ABC transport system permease protein